MGQQGSDGSLASNDGCEDDESVWGPNGGPEGDVGDGNLGDSVLGGFGLGHGGVGPQGVYVHLLGLFSQGVFVSPDGRDDGAVAEEDQDHWDQVAEEEAEQDVALVVPVVGQVVVGAGEEHAFSGEATPPSQ